MNIMFAAILVALAMVAGFISGFIWMCFIVETFLWPRIRGRAR